MQARLWFCAAVVLSTSGSILSAQRSLDYPQWRGQHRDGAASGFVKPTSWPKALTRRWKVEVGEGYATPLVIGETVYVFTRRDGHEQFAAVPGDDSRNLRTIDVTQGQR